jgi:hypothetical protein
VDEHGGISAQSISEELAGLDEKLSQLAVSSVHVDVKNGNNKESGENGIVASGQQEGRAHEIVKSPSENSVAAPSRMNLAALQEKVHNELHSELDQLEKDDAGGPMAGSHNEPMNFEKMHALMEARHKKRAENRIRLVKEISHRMDKLDKSLFDVASDRKAWETTFLKKYNERNATASAHQEPAPPSKAAFMSKRLQWSDIKTIHHHKIKVADFLEASQKRPVVVSKSDVHHFHWAGKLPKVAAITWIRGDRKTKARMMYFVDNFKLQDYEGSRELLLVYHSSDEAAARLVQHYANDTIVKGIPAHDMSQEMFPSDPALRYAAWTSDADVIAQWDFNEWHDPSRLSLQVRAMAHSGRHACVLSTMSTSHSQEDEDKEISQVSLVGERSWMKVHWHPFSRRKSEVLEVFKAGSIVEVDMQNKALMGNISRIEHVYKTNLTHATPAKDTGVKQGTAFSRGIDECLGYDSSNGRASEDAAKKAITEKVGNDFGKKFQKLVERRRDIISKLQLLCFQTTMERDSGKRKFMHDHVLEMVRIRDELDKHIKNTAALFGASEVR